ncbi:hypothetical protein Tco_0958373 [Tanacetum coccineum]
MSKLDRFLVSKGLLASFPYLSALCLDRNLSDHRPILMRESSIDYVPTPFRFFHFWFNLDDFDKMVEDTWKRLATVDSNGMTNLKKKHQALKIVIKQWTKNSKKSSYKAKISIQSKLFVIDKILDQGGSNEEIFMVDLCDENTKFFHDIHNSIRSQLAIRGILVDGELSLEQQADLQRNVFNEEIKSAVWDYGTKKSHGLDRLSFEFFRRYLKLLEHDIVVAIKEFFFFRYFSPGCNSSFIALISKIHDAKVVKDYHPISLIGSLYKIIPKILANRLSFVISGLISDVQSAFVPTSKFLTVHLFLMNFFRGASVRSLKLWSLKSSSKRHSTLYEEVDAATTTIGCLIFTTPFVHLEVKVGGTVLRTKGINLLDLIRKKVGKGINTLFWEDPWLDDLALKHKFSRLYALDNYKQITIVEKINHAFMVDTFRRPPRGGAEEEQLGLLLSRMDGLILTNILDR